MSANPATLKQQPDQIRETDPNVLQRRASNPKQSAWVGASAGAGKTTVLTGRMLRLMLPDAQGQPGTPPHKILALTFTKVAASEMAIKIGKRLSEWAVMPEDDLIEDMNRKLLGQDPTPGQIKAARKLFAQTVDAPGGMQIMTIHSFCQSVLGRFPIEAKIPPHFTVVENPEGLLQRAQDKVLATASEDKASLLGAALYNVAATQNEEQFQSLLKNISSERAQFKKIIKDNFDVDGLYQALCQWLDIPAQKSADDMLLEACQDGAFDETGLRKACKALGESDKATDLKKAHAIQNWLEADAHRRFQSFDDYKSAFLTASNTPLATTATKQVADAAPDVISLMQLEGQRLIDLIEKQKAARCAELTRDLFRLADAILAEYAAIKDQMAALDFDDLIIHTLALLRGETMEMGQADVAPWVRYKLDQGIEHILVDEAQDTNPEQWEIVKALSGDFFSGEGASETLRTIFVVGDEKQSIFSFQRANPKKFREMEEWFDIKIAEAGQKLERVPINVSFRSVKSVLELVDKIFEPEEMRGGLGQDILPHEPHRRGQAGLAEIWPIFKSPDTKNDDFWAPPTDIVSSSSGAAQMAEFVSNKIESWIGKETLPSRGRKIKAGDILILVRSRTAFVPQLVKALKIRKIPVSGVDRMVLNEQLAVQDLCAAARFGLLPEDDLNLACLLKSPLAGWDEDTLFAHAHARKGSLWQAVQDGDDKELTKWLSDLIRHAGQDHPYEFFSRVLQESCPAHPQSGIQAMRARLGEEAMDPIDEFLNAALIFEMDHIPALQEFLHWQEQGETEIKREMEESGDEVRIMTVHGAKGLQAPIVILPDTVRTSSSKKPERLLWPERSGADLPFFCSSKDEVPSGVCEQAMTAIEQKQDEEYRRLFYVAMTRAEDRLYIGGYCGKKDPIDESWYSYARRGFENTDGVQPFEIDGLDEPGLRLQNEATRDPDNREDDSREETETAPVPEWIFTRAPDEPDPPRPLAPSRPSEDDAPAGSPLGKGSDQYKFHRGLVTHKLLQILPDLPEGERRSAAEKFVALPGQRLDEKIQKSIVDETMVILEDPAFAPIFGPGSMAEVPVTGLIEGKKMISGQIDRLLVTDKEILIIDYKTNRPPPTDEKDVPDIYRKQMKAYKDAITQIYPDRSVKCALVWTDGSRLMELTV